MALLLKLFSCVLSILFLSKRERKEMSHRRIRQKARRQRRCRSRGQVWLPPDMVDASCLTNLLPATPLFTSPWWSRPVRKLLTASIGLTFSIIRLFSSTRFLGRLMAGCLVLATASSSTLLAATLKITFMLCVEQLPPTRRCRSRLEMFGLRKIQKKCDRVVKAPAGGGYEVVILAWPKLQATRCWTETPERGCPWKRALLTNRKYEPWWIWMEKLSRG